MKKPSGAKGDELSKVVPGLTKITDEVLYNEIWERPGLSPRDRSLITIACLIGMHRPEQMPNHMKLGMTNGLTKEEIGEAITHLAFYASWPNAVTAARKLLDLVNAMEAEEAAKGS
jgi:4-carboxymuconolactone decarboxylase